MSQLSESSDSSYWEHVFIKVQHGLIWIGNFAQEKRQKVLVRKLVDAPKVSEKAFTYVKVLVKGKVLSNNIRKSFNEAFRFDVLNNFFRVSVFFLWLQLAKVNSWIRNIILKPDAAIDTVY